MIVRMWRGYGQGDGVHRYHHHVTTRVFPELRKLAGYLAAYVLRRPVGAETEVLVVTVWESMDAVRGFAGDDPSRAVVEPVARATLNRFDATVTHHEVAHCDPLDGPGY